MRVIYAWIALLLIVIVGVGLFLWQSYYGPPAQNTDILQEMRIKLAQKYEEKAQMLSDSAMITAEELTSKQGSLTPSQQAKINDLMKHAKQLQTNADRLKEKNLSDAESDDLLRTCTTIYGEANASCRQLRTEVIKNSLQK